MAYVVVREQPDGSGNHYKYLYRSFRNEAGDVETEFLQYLGKADGPGDKKITKDEINDEILEKYDINENDIKKNKTQRGFQNRKIKHRNTVADNIELWADTEITKEEYKKAENAIDEWTKGKMPTKAQLESINKIEFYSNKGFDVNETNKEKTTAVAAYKHSERTIRFFNIEERDKEQIIQSTRHEAGHDTFQRLTKEKNKQEKEYNKLKRQGKRFTEEEAKDKFPAYYTYNQYVKAAEEEETKSEKLTVFSTSYTAPLWEKYEESGDFYYKRRALEENVAEYFGTHNENYKIPLVTDIRNTPKTSEALYEICKWDNNKHQD